MRSVVGLGDLGSRRREEGHTSRDLDPIDGCGAIGFGVDRLGVTQDDADHVEELRVNLNIPCVPCLGKLIYIDGLVTILDRGGLIEDQYSGLCALFVGEDARQLRVRDDLRALTSGLFGHVGAFVACVVWAFGIKLAGVA